MNIKLFVVLMMSLLGVVPLMAFGDNAAAGKERQETVFHENFENQTEVVKRFRGNNYAVVPGQTGNAICFTNKEKKNTYLIVPLPVGELSGCTVELSGSIKAENVSEKKKSWNGIKFQLYYRTGTGKKEWPAVAIPAGSFAWKTFSVTAKLPDDLKELNFCLGLEDCIGKVWYDDITVKVLKSPPGWKSSADKANAAAEETKKLLSVKLAKSKAEKVWPDTPVKGFVIPAYLKRYPTEELFKQLKDWNINVVRLWMQVDPKSPWDQKQTAYPAVPADNPMAPYEKNIEGLRIVLALAEKYHIYVIPVMDKSVWRGHDDMIAKAKVEDGNVDQAKLQEKYWQEFATGLGDFWVYIARNFGDHPWLLAYDILNEPHTPKEVKQQNELFAGLIKRIREVDKNTIVVVEPGPWGLPDQAFETLEPLADTKLVYSFHFYYPHTYTQQRIGAYKGKEYVNKAYPGMLKLFPDVKPTYWDKAALEKSMKNVIEFQKKHNVKIWVGEFSVVRWAPGSDKWLADTVDIFEKHGWSWTYHCYGGWWNGWNPTFAAEDPENAVDDGGKKTGLLQVLLDAWKRNKTY